MNCGRNARHWSFNADCNSNAWGKYENDNHENDMSEFLRTLSPGIQVILQYDHRPPAYVTFQGFENGNIILTDYDGFPGLVRIASDKVNAVSPFGYGRRRHGHRH